MDGWNTSFLLGRPIFRCYVTCWGGYGLLYKKWIGRPIALSAGVIFQGTPPKNLHIWTPSHEGLVGRWFCTRFQGRFGVNFFVAFHLARSRGVFDCFFFCDFHWCLFGSKKTTQWKSQVFLPEFLHVPQMTPTGNPIDLSEASEADAEAKRLAGVGMANMRSAMAQGFQAAAFFCCGGKDSDSEERTDFWWRASGWIWGWVFFLFLEGWWMFILILRWKLVICFQGFVLQRINSEAAMKLHTYHAGELKKDYTTGSIKHLKQPQQPLVILFCATQWVHENSSWTPQRPWD